MLKVFYVPALLIALLIIAPFFLYAQTDDRPISSNDADTSINDDSDDPASDDELPNRVLPPNTGDRPDPSTSRPASRNIDDVRPSIGRDDQSQDTNQIPLTDRRFDLGEESVDGQPARNLNTAVSPEERRQQMQADLERRQAEMQARGEERRAALQERAQERLLNLAANMSNRMEAAIRRMSNVVERLESRIEKLQTAGIETSEAEGHIATAKRHLTSAQGTLANIDEDVVQFIGSNDPRASWMRVKSIYETTRDDLRSAHQALREAVASLGRAIASSRATEEELPINDNE